MRWCPDDTHARARARAHTHTHTQALDAWEKTDFAAVLLDGHMPVHALSSLASAVTSAPEFLTQSVRCSRALLAVRHVVDRVTRCGLIGYRPVHASAGYADSDRRVGLV